MTSTDTARRVPSFESYGDYASGNYGVNALVFSTPEGDFYFSYKTLVAFRRRGFGIVVRENEWGPTTGKHLNWIDGGNKHYRLSGEAFMDAYRDAFGGEA